MTEAPFCPRVPSSSVSTALVLVIGLLATAGARLEGEEIGAPGSESRLVALVPLHAAIHGFRLPQYGEDGVLSSLVEVGQLERISGNQFLLREVRIHLFEDGRESKIIVTPQARFYLERRLLAGDHPVRVLRPGVSAPEVTGRGFVYDLNTQIWSLLRDVTGRFQIEKPAVNPVVPSDAAENPSENR